MSLLGDACTNNWYASETVAHLACRVERTEWNSDNYVAIQSFEFVAWMCSDFRNTEFP